MDSQMYIQKAVQELFNALEDVPSDDVDALRAINGAIFEWRTLAHQANQMGIDEITSHDDIPSDIGKLREFCKQSITYHENWIEFYADDPYVYPDKKKSSIDKHRYEIKAYSAILDQINDMYIAPGVE